MADRPDRATFASSWGTVLATAGVAIGLGNIWRFPYMMGRYGGSLFLLVYLVAALAFGVPALMTEWALARHTRRGPWGAFQRAGMPFGRWVSRLLLLTVTMAASYYAVVVAWVLYYAVAMAGSAVGTGSVQSFASLTGGFGLQLLLAALTIGVSGVALHLGVRTGIEKVSKIALPVFFLLLIVLIIRVLTLPGAMDGLKAFLVPHYGDFKASTPLAAMGQAFFSLGLGGTFMLTYGSYMRRDENLPKTALLTAGADVSAAVLASVIIVPAALAFDISLSSGPPLMFQVMPAVFHRMPAGSAFGTAFFVAVFLVGLLSLMAAYEVVVAALEDGLSWSRRRSILTVTLTSLVLTVPAILIDRYIEYSDLIWGTTMQPVGAVATIVALTWCVGRSVTLAEIRRSSRLPVPVWLFYWIKFGIPSGIVATLLYGWIEG